LFSRGSYLYAAMTNLQERSQFELEEPTPSMNTSTFELSATLKSQDDDDTELLSSFASMMVSSIETLGESTWNNSSTQNLSILIHQTKTKEDVQYQLLRNAHECFGYLQFPVCVSCIQDVPTELSVVSGKLILYVQAAWSNSAAELTDVFLHPLILEAIETLFIPVAIIPNRVEGQQALQLNVALVGFMDSSHKNLIEPICCKELSIRPILETAMSYVLKKNEQPIPTFLADMMLSYSSDNKGFERRAWFGFHDKVPASDEFCSIVGIQHWQFGGFASQADDPVVEIMYNYKETCYSSLLRQVLTLLTSRQIVVYCQSNDERMAARVEINKLSGLGKYDRQIAIVQVSKSIVFEPRIDNNCFTGIRQTPLRYVPMTEYQASKSNQLIVDGQYEKATALLSPRQVKILATAVSTCFKDFFDVVGYPIIDAWMSTMDKNPPHRAQWIKDDTEFDTELELYCI
jgi:hypothetical protein